MIIGLFVDLWNWWYTRTRVQLMRSGDARPIWQAHKLRLSILGVLYTIVEVDKSIPDALIDKYLIRQLAIVDDALIAINLGGMMTFQHAVYAEDDMKRYVLVKFIPNMPHWTWLNVGVTSVFIFVLIRVFTHYQVWATYVKPFLRPIVDAVV